MTPTWQSDDGSVVLYCADRLALPEPPPPPEQPGLFEEAPCAR